MLQDLPEELIERILSSFCTPLHSQDVERDYGNQQTLAAISRVNKTLRWLAQAPLYRICVLDDQHSLDSLLTTLGIARPEKAVLVRELRLGTRRHGFAAKGVQHESTLAALRSSFEGMLTEIFPEIESSTSLQTDLGRRLFYDDEQLRVALMISLCINLEVLVLDQQLWECCDLIPRVLDAGSQHKGQRLAELAVFKSNTPQGSDSEDSDDDDPDSDTTVSNMYRLPYLQTFFVHGLIMVDYLDSFAFTSIQAPLLSTVSFKYSMLDEAAILDILLHYPLLEHLKIHWGGTPAIDQFSTDYQLLGDHLRRHGRGLRTLELDIRKAMYNEFHDFTEQSSCLGSLAELTRLETLRVSHPLLLGELRDDEGPIESNALDHLLSDSLRHLELLSWPYRVSPMRRLGSIMNSDSLNCLSTVVLESGRACPVESEPHGWTSSREGSNLVFRRSDSITVV